MAISDIITAKFRKPANKGASRKLRALGFIPVNVNSGVTTPLSLSVSHKDFVLQRRQFGLSHVYPVVVEDAEAADRHFKILVKEIQQHPVTNAVLHVDFYRVDMTKPIKVDVAIELMGKPAGLLDGGLLTQILRTTQIQCLPDAIPTKLVGDVSSLGLGDSLHLSALVLPEGVRITAPNDEAVALVTEPEAAAAPVASEAAAAPAAAAAKPAANKAAATKTDKK